MTHDFKVGDHVEWNSEAGRVRGTIKKKVTSAITFKGYTVHASNAAAKTNAGEAGVSDHWA
jgi:Hypervirulence associated proteins TUDOR domain